MYLFFPVLAFSISDNSWSRVPTCPSICPPSFVLCPTLSQISHAEGQFCWQYALALELSVVPVSFRAKCRPLSLTAFWIWLPLSASHTLYCRLIQTSLPICVHKTQPLPALSICSHCCPHAWVRVWPLGGWLWDLVWLTQALWAVVPEDGDDILWPRARDNSELSILPLS